MVRKVCVLQDMTLTDYRTVTQKVCGQSSDLKSSSPHTATKSPGNVISVQWAEQALQGALGEATKTSAGPGDSDPQNR